MASWKKLGIKKQERLICIILIIFVVTVWTWTSYSLTHPNTNTALSIFGDKPFLYRKHARNKNKKEDSQGSSTAIKHLRTTRSI